MIYPQITIYAFSLQPASPQLGFIVITMNFSDQKTTRLHLQPNKDQKPPNLVSFHQVKSHDTRNRLLLQARNHSHPPPQFKIQNFQQTVRQQSSRKQRNNEIEEMRTMVQELTKQIQKLSEVNEGLIARIKQVEAAYHNLRAQMQQIHEEQKHKLKGQIYTQVEQYIKTAVQKITQDLKHERMAASLEDKLEKFMLELIEINPISVQHSLRKDRREEIMAQTSARTNNERADRYLTELAASKRNLPSKEHYSSIMKRLAGEDQTTNSYLEVSKFTTSSQDTRVRNSLATTPQKRRRIF